MLSVAGALLVRSFKVGSCCSCEKMAKSWLVTASATVKPAVLHLLASKIAASTLLRIVGAKPVEGATAMIIFLGNCLILQSIAKVKESKGFLLWLAVLAKRQ